MKIFARLVCLLVFSGLGAGIGWSFGPTTVEDVYSTIAYTKIRDDSATARKRQQASAGFALVGAAAGAAAGIFLGTIVAEGVDSLSDGD